MPVKITINKGLVPVKIFTDQIEGAAIDQLINLSRLPFIYSHIAAMPDVHCGVGATVGSVIPTINAIIPAAVGVDIGCGMTAQKLSLEASALPKKLSRLRGRIEEKVPVGTGRHSRQTERRKACKPLDAQLDNILAHHKTLFKMVKDLPRTWIAQMGSLGGGNHFIELCLDDENNIWIMLHSGSRGLGNALGRYFIAEARKLHQKNVNLPHRDLAYFESGTRLYEDYMDAVDWAQKYAKANRLEMMTLILETLEDALPSFTLCGSQIDCHHNYVALETHQGQNVLITRKGAISAREGEPGIVPGSMGNASYIVKGKGNEDSFNSSAHGAGRKMSRSAAKNRFKRSDIEEQTRGIECRKDKGVIDEIPAAYKNIDSVMNHQNDLVQIETRLTQKICIKG